jgi:hypothetical protein
MREPHVCTQDSEYTSRSCASGKRATRFRHRQPHAPERAAAVPVEVADAAQQRRLGAHARELMPVIVQEAAIVNVAPRKIHKLAGARGCARRLAGGVAEHGRVGVTAAVASGGLAAGQRLAECRGRERRGVEGGAGGALTHARRLADLCLQLTQRFQILNAVACAPRERGPARSIAAHPSSVPCSVTLLLMHTAPAPLQASDRVGMHRAAPRPRTSTQPGLTSDHSNGCCGRSLRYGACSRKARTQNIIRHGTFKPRDSNRTWLRTVYRKPSSAQNSPVNTKQSLPNTQGSRTWLGTKYRKLSSASNAPVNLSSPLLNTSKSQSPPTRCRRTPRQSRRRRRWRAA